MRWRRRFHAWGSGGGGGLTVLSFSGATTASGGGLTGTVGSTTGTATFSFTAVANPVGMPVDLEISVSSTLEIVITFPGDYAGAGYTYKDRSGVTHSGTFPATNGTVNF